MYVTTHFELLLITWSYSTPNSITLSLHPRSARNPACHSLKKFCHSSTSLLNKIVLIILYAWLRSPMTLHFVQPVIMWTFDSLSAGLQIRCRFYKKIHEHGRGKHVFQYSVKPDVKRYAVNAILMIVHFQYYDIYTLSHDHNKYHDNLLLLFKTEQHEDKS